MMSIIWICLAFLCQDSKATVHHITEFDFQEQAEVPWTSNEQMNRVMGSKQKRVALARYASTEHLSDGKTAADFLALCFSKRFHVHIHPYK